MYIIGGPPCIGTGEPVAPDAGTVEVLNDEHKVVATASVANRATFDIEVPPGAYTLIGYPQDTPGVPWESQPVVAVAGQSTDVAIYAQIS
jgi:hypothetical protein